MAEPQAVQNPSLRILFQDLVETENQERARLGRREADLEAKRKLRGKLADDEQRELDRLAGLKAELGGSFGPLSESLHASKERVHPLFAGVRDLINESLRQRAALISDPLENFSPEGTLEWSGKLSSDDVALVSLVLGLMSADEVPAPRVARVKDHIVSDPDDDTRPTFVEAFWAAVGTAKRVFPLAVKVLPLLAVEGDPDLRRSTPPTVKSVEFARVVRCLHEQGVKETEYQLRRRINECLNRLQNLGSQDPIAAAGISLPDLNAVSDYQIKPNNVMLMGPIICAAMFEELKVFQVLDKLVELSQNAMLPIGEGEAGRKLYLYWKDTPNRISEGERRTIYAQTLGIPGGHADGPQNKDFNDLWARFTSSVSSLVRQRTADNILRNNLPAGISQQQVRKAARDLAINLSSRGYGMTYYLALDLNAQIRNIIEILGDKDLRACYGAANMWQMIEAVATLELGGARNTARYSTLATCGGIITAWLAKNIDRYNRPTGRVVIDVDEVLSLDPPTSAKPTEDPSDYDLVNACELWLADTAISDQRIEELSQPREAPMMTSRPVQIPAVARDMLEQAGMAVPGFGMAAGAWR